MQTLVHKWQMKRILHCCSLLYKPLFVKSQLVTYNPFFFVPHTVTSCISKKHILLKHLEKLTDTITLIGTDKNKRNKEKKERKTK